jgi:hypothetical protein
VLDGVALVEVPVVGVDPLDAEALGRVHLEEVDLLQVRLLGRPVLVVAVRRVPATSSIKLSTGSCLSGDAQTAN